MIYELFQHVAPGEGDYGSEWKRIAVTRQRKLAAQQANAHRSLHRSVRFRTLVSKRPSGLGRLLWDFPPLNA